MATYSYMAGRKKYTRPQAMLFANNKGQIITNNDGKTLYAPLGSEQDGDFIILSDHNRQAIDFKPQRIENRKRLVNGRMRSYHIADKQTISTGWDMLPSRSYALDPNFNSNGLSSEYEYTADGGAGALELLDWYESNPGSFFVYLAYDNFTNMKLNSTTNADPYAHLDMYNEVIEVFFSDFSHSIQKRSGLFDLWNVSLSLEEV